ncbi:MAG TPA: choice-of-anchor E domain-containing protein, partial [Saprospiraceae bacterium]|nr:choice-of-anchor E domain-containing protein [Saprospiraceae bacterium]
MDAYVNNVTGGTVGNDQTFCLSGDPAPFTVLTAATGDGTLTYKWQSSTTSCTAGFTDIAGATGATYDSPAGLTTTTYYRRVTTSTLWGTPCTANSNCITVTINNVTAGVVGSDQTICSGGNPAAFTVTTPATGLGTLTYQWQSSTTSCSTGFADISGATSATYDAPAGLTTTTYYRRIVIAALNGVTCSFTSNCITVTINNVTGGALTSDQVVCTGGDPASFTQTTASTGSGTLTYQWQSSTTKSATCDVGFTNIPGATGITYDPPSGATSNLFYRRVTTSTLNGVACTAISNCLSVYVNNVTGGTVGSDQSFCSSGDPAPFTVLTASTGDGTLTYKWQSSTTSCTAGFTDIAGATSATYDAPAGLATTTYYRRVTTSTLYGTPCTATSNCITVTIYPPATVDAGFSTTMCASDNALSLKGIIGGGATSGTWTTSGTGTFNNPNALDAVYTFSAADIAAGSVVLTLTTNDPAGPCTAASESITITIRSGPTINLSASSQRVCAGANVSVTVNNVSGATYTWYGPNGFTSNTPNLTLSNVQLSHSGVYYLVVVDDMGCYNNVASSTFKLYVDDDNCVTEIANYIGVTDWNQTLNVNKFNGNCGTLSSISYKTNGIIVSHYGTEGTSTPSTITVNTTGDLTVSTPDGGSLNANLAFADSYNLGAFDGMVDFRGTSGARRGGHDYASASGTSTNFSGYTGAGTVAFPASVVDFSSMNATTGNTVFFIRTVAGADVVIHYCFSPTLSVQSKTACVGDNVTFTAVGNNSFPYTWTTPTGSTFTGNPLVVNNVSSANAGTYTVSQPTCGNCAQVTATATLTLNTPTAGVVGSDQTICSGGNPAAFTVTTAATGPGTLTYQWQSSTTSCSAGFADIAGATSATYDAPAGLTVTTYYRRIVTSTLNGVSCTATSNCITVTINNVTAGAVGTDQTICSGGNPAAFTVSTAATGSGALTYQWQSSTTSCSAGFADIAGATSATYDAPGGLTTTTYYRRIAISTLNSVACTATSNCITVTVNNVTAG